jgi:hypothetical protein
MNTAVYRRFAVHLILVMMLATPWLATLQVAEEEGSEVGERLDLDRQEFTAVQSETTRVPLDIWSTDYVDDYFPWGGDDRVQFKEYHDYFTMKQRMQYLADRHPSFMEFHEGMPGGLNDRGEETTIDTYEGTFYRHSSPWLKITANVRGGECNDFVGDCGNYADRPDVMLVGNHHAREWMSYEVPMMFAEMIAFYYGKVGIDNDGDGQYDEDPWGDSDGDGVLDDDGDCLSLNGSEQDSNGDGIACGAGDHGVDEDFSEQFLTDMVNTREIYLIPMLNVDGNRYDREEFCGENAWENCARSGWRKNLRDNTFTGITPIPDVDEEVNEGCDGVDLNRNYQYEWGAPLGATGPLFPGFCYAGQNNDVYNGPVDDTDNDGDFLIDEDHVDGKDDDADGLTDEDWLGGNSEPETKFIQDMTEMNDDTGDGASEFKATLTWHSFSELVLWPWGHCQDCTTVDDEYLIFHGKEMGNMTGYAPMQSSDLYPTTGDFCDWHYGVHRSYCYTIEIGNNFHENPEDIDHIAVRNMGPAFYMTEMADDPAFRAYFNMELADKQWIDEPSEVEVPDIGEIPVRLCLDQRFPFSANESRSKLDWRLVSPSRLQSDFGPTEWGTSGWQATPFSPTEDGANCTLLDNSTGTLLIAMIPVLDTSVGQIHYRANLTTTSGAFPIVYPPVNEEANYHTLVIPYRAPFGSSFFAAMMFIFITACVWGGLGFTLFKMFSGDDEEDGTDQTAPVEASDSAGMTNITVPQLKQRLADMGQPTSGRKADLVARLQEVEL